MNAPRAQKCTWCKRVLSVRDHFSKSKQRRCDSCQHIHPCCGCSCTICLGGHNNNAMSISGMLSTVHTAECRSRFVAEVEARPETHLSYPNRSGS